MAATRSSLLDALDSSFGMDASGFPLVGSAAFNAEASGSNTTKEMLAQARLRQMSMKDEETEPSLTDGLFLSQAMDHSSSRRSHAPVAGGFRLNYDDETPVKSIDVGGPDQQQRLAEFVTKSIDNLSHGLSVKAAMESLGLRDKNDLLPGLEVRLLPHQVIGVSWMLEQERGPNRGGILADDMGLGKTVQMIATMVMNQPEADDDLRTILVVVPAALLQQWKDEIDTKTNGIFTTHVHHGKDKLRTISDVESKDVIITSYQTLCMDFAVPKGTEDGEQLAWLAKNGGVLARTKYFRVIADEAQFIRNRSTRSSQTLALVRSRFRWMLTGTPVTNTLADIYGLLRFGRFRPWNDWNDFNVYVAKVQYEDAPLAAERARSILVRHMLRRTKTGMLEGKPLLELQPKEVELVTVDFSEEERDVYDSFEKRSKIRLNKFIKERTLLKHHTEVLVMILRLRQLCCHPNLILSQTDQYEDPTLLMAGAADKERGRATKIMGRPWVAQMKQRFLVRAAASETLDFCDMVNDEDNTCPVCHDIYMSDNARVLECGHELCFECLMELKQAPVTHDGIFGNGDEKQTMAVEKAYEEAVTKGLRPCPTCKKMLDFGGPKVFSASAFQPTDEELTNYARARRRNGRVPSGSSNKGGKGKVKVYAGSDDEGRDVKPKISPKRTYDNLSDISLSSDDDMPEVSKMFAPRPKKKVKTSAKEEVSDDDILDLTMDDVSVNLPVHSKAASGDSDVELLDDPPVSSPARDKSRSKRKARRGDDEEDGPSKAVLATWRKGDDDMEASTKMLALIEFLKDAGDDKTIVYSQWTSMLNLLETLFSRHGIQSLRYDGSMDRSARDDTLARFRSAGGPKVILISTKCGGVGLNLVAANRVVNMDLSWNYAAESQAYDRVHRLGQEKKVFVKRLVVRDTIEERMLQLQDVKTGLAEVALGEGTGAKLHKLSVKDIKLLFGMKTAPEPDGNQSRLPRVATIGE
ncbi:hypothetical protein HGRIS_007042 [Hohenbuehelia grisea]|uniref:Uncharacterized protein n=1 Tax=Hohenbuehelia grisea TaxID=104357 RepID=A0ABR3JBF6_9AGAR